MSVPYTVTFYEREQPAHKLTARLGDTPPTPKDGGGGFEVVALPKRAAVTVWRGRQNLLSMDVPIVLGDADHAPVAPARSALLSMWRPAHGTEEPPVVKVRSPGDAVPFQSLAWIISDLAWGDAVGGPGAHRLMQKLTVTLLEYRADERLQQEQTRKPKHRGRTYVVKTGDTLQAIAHRFKVKGGWRELAEAQHPPIRDPRSLKVGRRLLIP